MSQPAANKETKDSKKEPAEAYTWVDLTHTVADKDGRNWRIWYESTLDTAVLYWKRPADHPMVEIRSVAQKLMTTTPDKIAANREVLIAAIKEHGTNGMTAHIKKALGV